jgi:hypothetical protein
MRDGRKQADYLLTTPLDGNEEGRSIPSARVIRIRALVEEKLRELEVACPRSPAKWRIERAMARGTKGEIQTIATTVFIFAAQ